MSRCTERARETPCRGRKKRSVYCQKRNWIQSFWRFYCTHDAHVHLHNTHTHNISTNPARTSTQTIPLAFLSHSLSLFLSLFPLMPILLEGRAEETRRRRRQTERREEDASTTLDDFIFICSIVRPPRECSCISVCLRGTHGIRHIYSLDFNCRMPWARAIELCSRFTLPL